MVNIIVAGAAGRMGGRIINMIDQTEGVQLSAAFERQGSPAIGQDAGVTAGIKPLSIPVSDSLAAVIHKGDVIIDFTFHEATMAHARLAAQHKKPMVIGTTGLTKENLEELKSLTADFPCVQAPNMSVGVNLLYRLVTTAAQVLGDDYDIEIIEAHHRMKKDAPSGTALQLARVIAEAMGRNLDEVGVYARHGMIGERTKKEIGIQTIRAGDIVGEHTVLFGTVGERIEITHKASSRDTFAKGAVRAAKWVVSQHPGLYNMQDVLGLK